MAAAATLAVAAVPALAQEKEPVLGEPHPGGLGLQPAATKIAENMHFLHNVVLMPIITVITLFVLGLLFIVWYRFRESKN
ncbi:MAG TPA: cytochrome c oxidase subunit II transmembrane domain-containing protein, partial [Dongiaceae bacterium]